MDYYNDDDYAVHLDSLEWNEVLEWNEEQDDYPNKTVG